MSILSRRTSVIGAVVLAIFLAGRADALVLDWDSVAWAQGSLINSYDVNGDAVNDVDDDHTAAAAWTWRAWSGCSAPAIAATA